MSKRGWGVFLPLPCHFHDEPYLAVSQAKCCEKHFLMCMFFLFFFSCVIFLSSTSLSANVCALGRRDWIPFMAGSRQRLNKSYSGMSLHDSAFRACATAQHGLSTDCGCLVLVLDRPGVAHVNLHLSCALSTTLLWRRTGQTVSIGSDCECPPPLPPARLIAIRVSGK